jgi:hypothetical protein
VRFTTPTGSEQPRWVACTLLDSSGALVWGGNADCTRAPASARISAPAGTYRLMAGGNRGLAGDGELSISDGSQAPFELELRPGP